VSDRRGSGDVLAHALPQSFGRLPTGALAHAVAIAFVEPRGTHAPRSWSCASGGRVRTCAESPSEARLPQPRGAYAPRSWSCAFAGRRNCDFCDAQTHMHRSGGREPAVGRTETDLQRTPNHVRRIGTAEPRAAGVSPPSRMGNALAKALPRLRGRLPPVSWRTPLQWRCRNHGGLRPPRSCSRAVRQPTELRLLRCTNAHAAGAASVSPPWV